MTSNRGKNERVHGIGARGSIRLGQLDVNVQNQVYRDAMMITTGWPSF